MNVHFQNLDKILFFLYDNKSYEHITYRHLKEHFKNLSDVELENYLNELEFEYNCYNHTEPCANCRRTQGFFRISLKGINFCEDGGFKSYNRQQRIRNILTPARSVGIAIWALVTTLFTLYFAYQANKIAKDSINHESTVEVQNKLIDSLEKVIYNQNKIPTQNTSLPKQIKASK